METGASGSAATDSRVTLDQGSTATVVMLVISLVRPARRTHFEFSGLKRNSQSHLMNGAGFMGATNACSLVADPALGIGDIANVTMPTKGVNTESVRVTSYFKSRMLHVRLIHKADRGA